MRRLMAAWMMLLGMAAAQTPFGETPVPAPPPLVPQPMPGEPAPFNPAQTREATPKPALEIRAPGYLDPDAPEGVLDLLQAVELALRLQPDILTSRGQLRQAEGTVIQQRAALLPRVNLQSTFLHTSSTGGYDDNLDSATLVTAGTGGTVVSSGGRTTQRLTSSLGLSQLLFDFGRTRSLVLQADLQRQAAAATILQTENDVILDVKERFYNLILSRRLVQVRLDELANRQ